jgi:hypothetical protein
LAFNETLTSLKLGSKRNKSKVLEICPGERFYEGCAAWGVFAHVRVCGYDAGFFDCSTCAIHVRGETFRRNYGFFRSDYRWRQNHADRPSHERPSDHLFERSLATNVQTLSGDAPRYVATLRTDGIRNADVSFSKEFAIRESMKLQIRGEFFNFTNTVRFAAPNTAVPTDPSNPGSFGTTASDRNIPRQFGLRFEF